MALTNIKRNPTGIAERASGYLSGTYTAATVTSTPTDSSKGAVIASGVLTISLGFAPKKFKIINCTDRLTQEWFEGLAANNFLETAANGDKTLETDGKVAVSGSTVVVTFDGGAVTDNDTVVWEASA